MFLKSHLHLYHKTTLNRKHTHHIINSKPLLRELLDTNREIKKVHVHSLHLYIF